jgi:hypothetical protein
MVAQLEVRLKEGWFDMKKILGKIAGGIGMPVKQVGKALGIGELSGSNKMGAVGPGKLASLIKESQAQNALQEGQARIAPKKMSKGGAMHKMPDGSMMKGAVHKASSGKYIKPKKKKKNTKVSKSQCSRRADGCAVKGKTRGRMV